MDAPIHDIFEKVLFHVGGTPVTLAGLLVAAAIAVLSFLISHLAVLVIGRARQRVSDEGSAGLYILEKFTGYTIVIVGLLLALSSIGLNLSSLAVFAGALGVGVGLGLQGVIKEFVSGIVLLFDSLVNVGDYIELPGSNLRGVVLEIGTRAIHIRNNDNVDIFVPNSRLIEERFINWTLRGQTRRIHVPFGVAYGTDKALVRDVVLKAARSIEATMPDEGSRRSQVWLVGFGDSSLNFELVVWPNLAAAKRPNAMTAAYLWAIDDALREAGIEIPFPQRDLHLRSVLGRDGDAALAALGFSAAPDGHKRPAPASLSRNDAAQDLASAEEDDLEPPPEKES